MQLKIKNKKIYALIIAGILVIVAIVLFLTSNRESKIIQTNETECEAASKVAQEAALAWGNTDDMRSQEYQNKLKSYLTDEMKKNFEDEWTTIEEKVSSSLELQGVTCSSEEQTVVDIGAIKSENDSSPSFVQITVELIKENGKYMVSGFADNYDVRKIH